MPIRNVNDPYGGNAPLVDKMIGTAYDVVKYVARHVKSIEKVACNMVSVVALAKEVRLNKVVTDVVPAAGATVSLAMPVGVTAASIVGFDVLVKQTNGDMFPLGSVHFTADFSTTGLDFTTAASGTPVGFVGAEIVWNIFYKGDLNDV